MNAKRVTYDPGELCGGENCFARSSRSFPVEVLCVIRYTRREKERYLFRLGWKERAGVG